MTNKNYLMINTTTNVVDNICVWDGDMLTWSPPDHLLMLLETTIAKVWGLNETNTDFILISKIGAGGIGFTFDGEILTTNEEKPNI